MEKNYYTAEELEIGKVYLKGGVPVILRERTGEKETHRNSSICNVYIFDELRDVYIDADYNSSKQPLQVEKNKKVLLNPEFPCFNDFNIEEYKKEKIESLKRQVEAAEDFLSINKTMNKFEIAEQAWLFMDKKLPDVMGEDKISLTDKLPMGIVCFLMHEFAEEFHNNQK
jgi:hypothetical protein